MSIADAYAVPAPAPAGRVYAAYVLALMTLCMFLNFLDRTVLSIVAEQLKADLHLTDAQLGFLYGTAFASFFAVFGIVVGRMADFWRRSYVAALGLVMWSGMTALSGLATQFSQLAFARIGVAVGEASTSSCAYSLLADYYPKKNRATAFAVYIGGIYLGMGASLYLGGLILDHWSAYCAFGKSGACHFRGWQIAFFAFGAPGLVLAVLVAGIREPIRGLIDGTPTRPSKGLPWRVAAQDLAAVVPPFSLFSLARHGGRSAVLANLIGAAVISGVFGFLTWLTDDWKQWGSVGLATYAAFSWSQSIKRRDPPLHRLTWHTPAFMLVIVCFAAVGLLNAGVLFWITPFAIRVHGLAPSRAGLQIGTTIAICATVGSIAGGALTDRWRRTDPRSPVWVGIMALLVPMPIAFVMFLIPSTFAFLVMVALFSLTCPIALAAGGAMVQELVLPRMRGAASAIYALCVTLLSSAFGPYLAGKVSTLTGSLAFGVLSLYILVPFALPCYVALGRKVLQAEATRFERARHAGEVML